MPNGKNKIKTELNRTVSFWRFVRMLDGAPMAQANWPVILSDWAPRTQHAKITHIIDQEELSGRVHTISGTDHLVITKDRDDIPRQQHRRTGATEEITTKSNEWEVVESSFVSFLGFSNVFGFLQSALTAASPAAVARWINETNVLQTRIKAEPVIDRTRWEKVRAAGGVTMLEVAGPVSLVNNLNAGPLQALLNRQFDGQYKLRVEITTGRTRQYRHEREDLHAAAEQLSSATTLGHGVHTAKARVFDDADTGIESQVVNFMKQRFSKKEEVLVIGGPGERSISESSACSAILRVADEFDAELRAATRAPSAMD